MKSAPAQALPRLRLDSIPVYARDAEDTDTKAAAGERVVHQIVANDHRAALTDVQRAKASSR